MDARGGILEPPGIVEVKYRAPQQLEAAFGVWGFGVLGGFGSRVSGFRVLGFRGLLASALGAYGF